MSNSAGGSPADLEAPLLRAQEERGRLEDSAAEGAAGALSTSYHCSLSCATSLLADLLAWSVLYAYCVYLPDAATVPCRCAVALLMVLYRLVLYRSPSGAQAEHPELPYSCGVITTEAGQELFLVATMHISPKAPEDVESTIHIVRPDVVMIELDEERLDRMVAKPEPDKAQPMVFRHGGGAEPVTVMARRALWNAEKAGKKIAGRVAFQADNAFGATPLVLPAAGSEATIALVDRGGPEGGQPVTFFEKAHNAAAAGAVAVLVSNSENGVMPAARIGVMTLEQELRLAWRTCKWSMPRIPLLVLPHAEGSRLKELCLEPPADGAPHVEFEVLHDDYPRRSTMRRLCQGCALMVSGIGVLYGVIGCFRVQVGAEFTSAKEAACKVGTPCLCIDVDLNMFWSNLLGKVLPTPRNLLDACLSWLAFPRVAFRVLFPERGAVDCIGSTVLHLRSLSLRTWAAFVIAGYAASYVTTNFVQFTIGAGEMASEEAGAVSPMSDEDRETFQLYCMGLLELYMLPQVYAAVAAARDESMYRSIVTNRRKRSAEGFKSDRLVVVVGAAHANGILSRVRARGL
eukprot:TRINITY_DN54650_c0_g1_i2.p1 TRINITY_DN54650_c0_g1~~TRINITY_DN54650_c0_g1_i2.p1  ORF type:complete len:573 (+),score=111.13 TRINITY_DN54650_c0_g1_i2:60-1778(+)